MRKLLRRREMKRYSLSKRGRIWYAQLKNSHTKKFMSARSTGQTDYDEALLVVVDWLKNGMAEEKTIQEEIGLDSILYGIRTTELDYDDAQKIVDALIAKGLIERAVVAGDGPDSEPLIPFLLRHWVYETSPYVKEKHAYGHSIGRRHCYEMTKKVENYWTAFFGERIRLCDLERGNLEEFQLHLAETLAPNTVKVILNAGTIILNWVADKGIIKDNPAIRLRRFSGKAEKRGILSPEEARKLFSLTWKDERARVGSLVAMSCGLRIGEVVALRVEDIKDDRLEINHSWSFADGLKAPKNGEVRIVPLLPAVKKELLELAFSNPHKDKQFIFYGTLPDKPCDLHILQDGLRQAVIDIRLPEDERRDPDKRTKENRKIMDDGIVFHSWRHYYARHLADRIEMRKVQLATGHKSGAMAEHYANHGAEQDFLDVAKAVDGAFGNILPFEKDA